MKDIAELVTDICWYMRNNDRLRGYLRTENGQIDLSLFVEGYQGSHYNDRAAVEAVGKWFESLVEATNKLVEEPRPKPPKVNRGYLVMLRNGSEKFIEGDHCYLCKDSGNLEIFLSKELMAVFTKESLFGYSKEERPLSFGSPFRAETSDSTTTSSVNDYQAVFSSSN